MNSPIEEYLAALQSRLGMNATTRAQIVVEVRTHLEEAVAHEEAMGADHAEAERRAIGRFGPAQEIAQRFNAAHPAEWDARRFVKGVAWGVVASWFLWTLVTYPLLAYLTLRQGHLPGNPPGLFSAAQLDLLFYATPLAFGAMWVLATSPLLWLAPFLMLFLAVPFVWGRHSQPGWRPGLAYGLGVVVGFPWLLPAVVVEWTRMGARQGIGGLLITLAIWLLAPLAMLASWLGSRLHVTSLRRRDDHLGVQGMRSQWMAPLTRVLSAVGALALVALSAWAWTAAAAWGARPTPTPDAQLAAAQRGLEFAIRLPATLPDGVRLMSAQAANDSCASCAVSLVFQGRDGKQLILDETDHNPTNEAVPAPPDYQVSQVGTTSVHPVWWLESNVIVEQQVNLDWTSDGLFYFLGSDGSFSLDELKQIADSIPTGVTASQGGS